MSLIIREVEHAHSTSLWLDSGKRIVIGLEDDGEGGTHAAVFFDGVRLDGPEHDGEASLRDLYAVTGVDFDALMLSRARVFDRHLAQEALAAVSDAEDKHRSDEFDRGSERGDR